MAEERENQDTEELAVTEKAPVKTQGADPELPVDRLKKTVVTKR